MSLLTYFILFVVAAYLFKVNPVLCVVLVGAVVFFKIRGFFGGKHNQIRSIWGETSEAALVPIYLVLLEQSERAERQLRSRDEQINYPDGDPLDRLFS